jgi:MFS family permease
MQIPVGILVDNYGPKRPLLCAAVLITIGGFLFSSSHSLMLSYFSRGLVGFGSSFGYLCCLKIVVNWFQSRHFAFMCSLVNMIGMIGAFLGEVTLSHLMNMLTWRELLFNLSFVGIVVVVLVGLFVKNFPQGQNSLKSEPIFKTNSYLKKTLLKIITSKQILLAAVYIAFVYCTFDTIDALWGTSYLEKTYNLTRDSSAEISSLIFLGAIIGYPLFGWLTSYLPCCHKRLMIIAVTLMATASFLIWLTPHSINNVRMLFLLLGLCAGSTATATTLAKESMPLAISGITMSFVNTAVVMLGALSQPLFGYLLEWHHKIIATNLNLLSIGDFHLAFFLMPCLYVIALICAIFLKQPKQQVA